MAKLRVHREGYEREDGTHVEGSTYLTEDKGELGRTPEDKQWYHPKVQMDWHKDMPTEERRRNALAAHKGDELATARSLGALANVTTDEQTKAVAWTDAQYFYNLHEGKTIKGYGRQPEPGYGHRVGHNTNRKRQRHGRLLTRTGNVIKTHRGSLLR